MRPSCRRTIAWSRKLIKAFDDNPVTGVVKLDGKMLDKPHLRAAVKILAVAESRR
jgi:citrate lyase subunit beta/citryl-CoA lyase